MVRQYGAQLTEITDRAARILGVCYPQGVRRAAYAAPRLDDARRLGVMNLPWWARSHPQKVLRMDDMEGTLLWRSTVGTLTKASEAQLVHSGVSALKLVTGAVAGNTASAWLWTQAPTNEDIWLEVSMHFCIQAAANTTPRFIGFAVGLTDVALAVEATFGLRYYHYNAGAFVGLLYRQTDPTTWVSIAASNREVDATLPIWARLALLMHRDPASGWSYERATMQEMTKDLASAAVWTGAVYVPYTRMKIETQTEAAAATTCYVDDIMIAEVPPP